MRVTPRYDGPALLEIAGPLDDQLVPLTRQRRRFETMLAGLTDDEWSAPTLWDCWIHERDVALPLGRTPAIEADEVASSLRYAAALGPGFLINGGDGCRGRFAVDAHRPPTQFWLEVDDSVHVHDGGAPGDAP